MRTLFVVLLLSVNCTFVFAQEEKNTNEKYSSEIKVYFLNGYGGIYQYKYSEKSSYRVQIDINGNILDSDGEYNGTNDYENSVVVENKNNQEEKTKSFSILISPQYCYTIYKIEKFSFYLGAGPSFSYSYSNHETDNESNSVIVANETNHYVSKNTNRIRSLGIMGFVGIDGNVNDNLKIFSEVYISGSRKWNKEENEVNQILQSEQYYHQTSKGEVKSWEFSISNINVGISYSF